jgi:hypothetical protein
VHLGAEKFKYKLQDGFVVFNNNRFKGVPLILYSYQILKNRLTLDKEDKLLWYVRGSAASGILIFPFGSSISENYRYTKLK